MQAHVDETRARNELIRGAVVFLKDADGTRKDPEKVRLAERIVDASRCARKPVAEALAEWTRRRMGGATQQELKEAVAPYMDRLHEADAETDETARELVRLSERR